MRENLKTFIILNGHNEVKEKKQFRCNEKISPGKVVTVMNKNTLTTSKLKLRVIQQTKEGILCKRARI